MKLRLVAVALAALTPVVAMLGYNEYAMRSQRNNEVRFQAEQASRQASSEVERIVEGLHSLLIAVRAMPAVRDLDREACANALKSVASSVANIRMIFVVPAGSASLRQRRTASRSNFRRPRVLQAGAVRSGLCCRNLYQEQDV